MHASTKSEAAECQETKQQLVNARTEQETDIAYKKMCALCDQ
jgi:hypothetical protein